MESSTDSAPLDVVVERLQAIRDAAGQPSFGDIALGVSRVRRSRGMSPEQSRVGRTTVYDAFRTGRRRLGSGLVSDIVLALGGDEELAAELAEECRAAQAGAAVAVRSTGAVAVVEHPSLGRRFVLLVLIASVVVNLMGRALVDLLGLPIHLDMTGTAFSAILLGPWWGALVGVVTNVAGVTSSGPLSLWFIPVNVVGALVWGYGARRWRMARSIPRFFVLNVAAGVACTLLAAPIIMLVLGGLGQHSADTITATILAKTHSETVAVYASNLLASVPDKLVAGFVTLALVEALPIRMRAWAPSTWMRDHR